MYIVFSSGSKMKTMLQTCSIEQDIENDHTNKIVDAVPFRIETYKYLCQLLVSSVFVGYLNDLYKQAGCGNH